MIWPNLFRRKTSAAVAATDLGKPSPLAPIVHTAVAPPPRKQGGGYTWTLEAIRSARDAQLRGCFDLPVRMAEAFRTNDAMFTAYQARVATQSAIKLLWRPADSDAGRAAGERAERLVQTPQHARESILGTLANHGIAIGYVTWTALNTESGPEVSMLLTEWPLEHVRYNASTCTLETRTRENGTVTISHGDGRWIVFRKFGVAPWTQDACVLPGALLWAAHGGAVSDWAGASFSHGQPKVIGTLREGASLGDGETLTPEAQAMLNVISALVSGDSGAGVLPAGSKAELLFNGSTAWQVFDRLSLNREKAAMRIYLGTDAALGSQGGAPGVDIASLFNVASTRIQGDLEALERGFREGMIEPWARMHGVEAADIPELAYAMPDADGERRSAQEASAVERLGAMVATMKSAGLEVSQDTIDALVRILGITVPCVTAAAETKVIPIELAPTDVARVVKVREARAAQGLPPLGDERDELFIAELEAQAEASALPADEDSAPTDPPAPSDEPNPANDTDGGGRKPSPGWPHAKRRARMRLRAAKDDADNAEPETPEDAADAALDQPIDGDGDGVVDEEEKELERQKRKIERALRKREIARKKAIQLDKKRQDEQSKIEAANGRAEQLNDSLHDLDELEGYVESAETDDERKTAERDLAEAREANAKAEKEIKQLEKDSEKYERQVERLDDKISNLNSSSALDVNEEVTEYVSQKENYVSGLEAAGDERHAKAKADLDALHEVTGTSEERFEDFSSRTLETEEEGAQRDEAVARAVVTGPKGGRYYITPSGEKEYVD